MNYSQVPCLPYKKTLFPIKNGKYEVGLGLNACFDEKSFFQKDINYDLYIEEKLKNKKEPLDKYYLFSERFEKIENDLVRELLRVWNTSFPDDHKKAKNFYEFGNFAQEDISVVMKNDKDEDSVEALHLSFPNHWRPKDKFQASFTDVHMPIANIQPLLDISSKVSDHMFNKGPCKRFAWSLSTDTQLNHHPDAPEGADKKNWDGRSFNKETKELYLRVERQIIWPIKKLEACIFTIKTYFLDIKEIKEDAVALKNLISAIESMNKNSLKYKGLQRDKESILNYLKS